MMEHMGVIVEVWPMTADETGIWLLSGTDAWRSDRVPADDEPHSELDHVLYQHGARRKTIYQHSTSWRVDGPHVVLTYIAVVDVGDQPARVAWREAEPIGPMLAAHVGPAAAGPALEPPTPRHIDVVFHALRHLRWLLGDDAVAADSLTDHWVRHLRRFDPALAVMYSDTRAG